MVYPGPWEQSADYDRAVNEMTPRGMADTVNNSFSEGAAPYDDEMNAALNSVTAGTPTSIGLQASLSITQRRLYPDGSLDLTAEKNNGGAEWTAAGVLDLSYHYSNHLVPGRPADAVGIEYAASESTPVGALLHLVTNSSASDSTIPDGQSATVDASLTVTLLAAATPVLDLVAPAPTRTEDIDLTPYMGSRGECAVELNVAKRSEWHYYDPYKVGPISVTLNATTGTQMVYTLHPPRHRWLYDTPLPTPGLPPLRQFPRDDNLGMSSAARVWPTSSQQGSLRRHGYY